MSAVDHHASPGQWIFTIILVAFLSADAAAQREDPLPGLRSQAETRLISLPTDRDLQSEVQKLEAGTTRDFSQLMKPRYFMAAEWEGEADGIAIGNYDARITVPTYPFYGPPPPLISAGFSYTDLHAPSELMLPSSLYDFTIGAAWMRRIHDAWMLRFMASAALASDLDNMSSDAWQFRGGVFATYECRPDLQLLIGAFASGRSDIPVLPGIGAIWTPTPYLHLNLMMPRPRVSYMIADGGNRQHWIYFGGGLSGGTWAFRSRGTNDEITYREWRIGLGWEITPPKSFPPIPASGLKFEAEVGYVFGREFEFDTRTPSLPVSDTWLLRAGVGF